MSTTQKPEALRLADKYEAHGFLGDHSFAKEQWCSQAAVELRSQHARIAELEAQLSAIGAGGVEPLRKREEPAALAAHDERWLSVEALADAYKDAFAQKPVGKLWANLAVLAEALRARAAIAATQAAGELAPHPPLFGHPTGRKGLTHWMVFMKPLEKSQ